jgi:hypothetical protein
VDLGACERLAVPEGSKLALHAYADGVQIYRWNGSAWAFVAPAATLYADAGGHARIGTHYAGPTWETASGSKVSAAVLDRCPVGPSDIPWLKLGVVTTSGHGVFDHVTHILRLYTLGGVAPSAPGTEVGDEARVPYTAEYFFYRAP